MAWPFFSFALQEVGHANAAQDPAFGSITSLCGAMLSPRFAHLLSTPDGPLRGERMEQARPRERACGAQRNF